MFSEHTKQYLIACLDHSDLGADYTDAEEDEIFERLEDLHWNFNEPGITGNDMCHDLNLLEGDHGCYRWKSPTPSTFEDAMRAYREGDLMKALECNRHTMGTQDKPLRQGLILSCYRRLIDDDALYDRFERQCPNLKAAKVSFLTLTGGSC